MRKAVLGFLGKAEKVLKRMRIFHCQIIADISPVIINKIKNISPYFKSK